MSFEPHDYLRHILVEADAAYDSLQPGDGPDLLRDAVVQKLQAQFESDYHLRTRKF